MATYYLQDDSVNASGLSGGTGNQISPNFQSDTLGHAQTLAQQFATLFQRSCRLVPVGSAGPYTPVYTPAASGSALGSQPTGISI